MRDYPSPIPQHSFDRRFLAAVVDLGGVFCFIFILSTPISLILEATIRNEALIKILLIPIMVLLGVVYFVGMEAVRGQTFDKWVFGLVVISDDQTRCSLWHAIVRNLFRPVDLCGGYLLGGLAIIFSDQNKRIGDYVANTQVLCCQPALASVPLIRRVYM